MIENVKIVSSLRSSDNSIFTVTFSSGEKLDFTADEAFEFGLYEESTPSPFPAEGSIRISPTAFSRSCGQPDLQVSKETSSISLTEKRKKS